MSVVSGVCLSVCSVCLMCLVRGPCYDVCDIACVSSDDHQSGAGCDRKRWKNGILEILDSGLQWTEHTDFLLHYHHRQDFTRLALLEYLWEVL